MLVNNVAVMVIVAILIAFDVVVEGRVGMYASVSGKVVVCIVATVVVCVSTPVVVAVHAIVFGSVVVTVVCVFAAFVVCVFVVVCNVVVCSIYFVVAMNFVVTVVAIVVVVDAVVAKVVVVASKGRSALLEGGHLGRVVIASEVFLPLILILLLYLIHHFHPTRPFFLYSHFILFICTDNK